MDLKTYLKSKSRKQFAEEIKTTIHYLNNLCQGAASPGKHLALRIEEATGGAVTRMELLYPEKREAT
jgi:DNA-binding transcriptional regulator YdaS (Cro superfamily)